MEVHKIYCDKQSCKKEIKKSSRCKTVISIKKPSNSTCDLREREMSLRRYRLLSMTDRLSILTISFIVRLSLDDFVYSVPQ